MRIGWGTGIALFYLAFVVSLLLQLKHSMSFDHSLVTDEYYKEDLAYQERFDKMANSQSLANRLKISEIQQDEFVKLQFPQGFDQIEGTILFFRPSNQGADFEVDVKPNQENQQTIATNNLDKGLWKIKIEWQAGESAFYDEISVVL